MNFMEAVKEMKKGKKVKRKDWDYYILRYGSLIYNKLDDEVTGDFTFEDFIATDWEVVDKDKNWNLAEQHYDPHNNNSMMFGKIDIKKCRDLIAKDIINYKDDYISKSQVIYHIDKRFGDLE